MYEILPAFNNLVPRPALYAYFDTQRGWGRFSIFVHQALPPLGNTPVRCYRWRGLTSDPADLVEVPLRGLSDKELYLLRGLTHEHLAEIVIRAVEKLHAELQAG